MRYRLRTLLIVLALGPIVLFGAWLLWRWASTPPSDVSDAPDVFIHDSYIEIETDVGSKRIPLPPN